jgi:hypothetical protein
MSRLELIQGRVKKKYLIECGKLKTVAGYDKKFEVGDEITKFSGPSVRIPAVHYIQLSVHAHRGYRLQLQLSIFILVTLPRLTQPTLSCAYHSSFGFLRSTRSFFTRTTLTSFSKYVGLRWR